jgi:hypothetical protein
MDADKQVVTAEGSGESTAGAAAPPVPPVQEPGPWSSGEPTPAAATTRPQVTFMGNSYDLTAVLAAALGVLMVVTCLTCGTAYYCVPPAAVVLGLVGLISTKDAVDAERTRLLSWIGIAGGGIVLLLIVLGIVAYVGLIVLAVAAGNSSGR